ncbi:MAG: glycosyltransferase family 1 protein [Sphingobacteriales bacterium]|nr:MAG: glycosyltransferase family 1 protein [Sphingobacteriales bacterium]
MNVLELNFERGWRGGERQTIYNMEGFRHAGINVSLVCREGFELEEKASNRGFNIHTFNTVWGVVGHLIAKGRQYDILHAQTSHILTYCILTKPFHRCKIVLSRRVVFKPKGMLTLLKYRLTDRVVGISTAIKRVLKLSGVRDVAVITDMVVESKGTTDIAQQIVDPYKLQGKHVVATVSMLTPDKDPLTMVDTIKLLLKKRSDFVFLHFGQGELKEQVQAKINAEGLQDVYKLMGYQKEIEPFYPLFDVFVMSSKQEGLGSSVLDAFMNKVPVVATNAGGLKELLSEGRGIPCSVGVPEQIAEGINRLLEDGELHERTATRAYSYAVRRHSIKAVTEQYHELFKDLLN